MLDDAKTIIAAAEKKALDTANLVNIAVVDPGRNLGTFARMDDAWLGSIDIGINKAFTARTFNTPTEQLATMSQPDKPFFGIQTSNNWRVMIFATGIPLKRDRKVVGAVGFSSGQGEQDQAVAEAGAAAFS